MIDLLQRVCTVSVETMRGGKNKIIKKRSMKISEVTINNFKRFTDLKITNISPKAKIVIIIGPNGSGKSSLFDAFHRWYRNYLEPYYGHDDLYYAKSQEKKFDYNNSIKISFHDFILKGSATDQKSQIEGKFYFRTAYRNQADFTTSSLNQMENPVKKITVNNLIQNDQVVSENYQRLISLTLKGVYNPANDNKIVKDLREDLIGKIRQSLLNIFEDLTLSSIGDPLQNGTFYFEKGSSKDYHYKNLSGGEKAAFDIILDLIVKSSYFKDAIYCIDEPETHMHTRLQASLFTEIYRLIPQDSQLWINTHSLGILKQAKEIAESDPEQIAFLSFDDLDFDRPIILSPTNIDKQIWEQSIQLALDDFSQLIVPKKVILCEGDVKGRKNKNFDATIYNKIFSSKYNDTLFVSIGGANELEDDNNISFLILRQILQASTIIRLVDCDDKNDEEREEYKTRGIKVLSRRHIESYLWDDEILIKFCALNNPDKKQELISLKNEKLIASNQRGNSKDDIKSASDELYASIKKIFNLTKSGSNKEVFLRDTIAPLITPDTNIYKLLEQEIFE